MGKEKDCTRALFLDPVGEFNRNGSRCHQTFIWQKKLECFPPSHHCLVAWRHPGDVAKKSPGGVTPHALRYHMPRSLRCHAGNVAVNLTCVSITRSQQRRREVATTSPGGSSDVAARSQQRHGDELASFHQPWVKIAK